MMSWLWHDLQSLHSSLAWPDDSAGTHEELFTKVLVQVYHNIAGNVSSLWFVLEWVL